MEKTKRSKTTLVTVAIVALLLGLVILYVAGRHDPIHALQHYLAEEISPPLFFVLMAILPIFGAPISLFLVLVGMKFGIIEGILLSLLTMLLHVACTYFLVHSFLRPAIGRLVRALDLPLPPPGSTPNNWRAFLFMLIPGLPYAVKNTLLALSGISILPYVTISWVTQLGLGLPFIILGGAVLRLEGLFILLAVGLFTLVTVIQVLFKKRLQRIEKAVSETKEPARTLPFDREP